MIHKQVIPLITATDYLVCAANSNLIASASAQIKYSTLIWMNNAAIDM